MVTLRDVAQEVGVSVSAVSMALRNHASIGEETKQRVRETATRLGYRLRKRPVGNIAFMLFDRQFDASYARFFQTIGELADQHDQQPLYLSLSGKEFLQGRIPAALQRHNLDGMIVSGLYNEDIHRRLTDLKIPLIVLGNYQLGDEPWAACEVDLGGGIRLGLRQFAKLGRTRVAMIASSSATGEYGLQIRQGFRNAAAALGLDIAGMLDQREFQLQGSSHLKDAITELLQGPGGANGLIVEHASDELFAACASLDLKIPDDLSLIALGTPEVQTRPILTRLESNLEEMGQGAFFKLSLLMQQPKNPLTRELFGMRLVVGESLQPVPSGSRRLPAAQA